MRCPEEYQSTNNKDELKFSIYGPKIHARTKPNNQQVAFLPPKSCLVRPGW